MGVIEEFKRRITLMFSAFSSMRKSKCEHVFTAYKRFDCEEKCYPTKLNLIRPSVKHQTTRKVRIVKKVIK